MFLSTIQADDDRAPTGNFWFEPIGMKSSAGLRVTPLSAMRLAAVLGCVRVLAETFAVLPFQLYRRKKDRSRELLTDHWLYRLLAKRPNRFQTPFEWKEMMMGHLALRGNAFNELVIGRNGDITELLPIHPDRIKIELIPTAAMYRYVVTRQDGSSDPLPRGAVWHIKGLSDDGIVGLNPIELAREVLGLGQAAQTYGARFFANDAKPGGWIEMPTGAAFKDDTEKEKWRKEWQRNQSGQNRGKTAILERGMKYHELALNNVDAQFLETRKMNRSEICSLFRVPPHKIGDLERATFTNIEQQSLDFVVDTMTPIAERFESSIEYFLLLEEDQDLEVEFGFANLVRGDMQARGLYYTKRFQMGSMSPNDIRVAEGEQPIAGGDVYLVPLNMVTLQNAGVPQGKKGVRPAPAPTPEDGGNGNDGEQPPDDEGGAARAMALANAVAERVARKEAAMLTPLVTALPMPVEEIQEEMAKHAGFVAAALGVSDDAAQAYVKARGSDPIRKGSEEADVYASAYEKLQRLALKGHL